MDRQSTVEKILATGGKRFYVIFRKRSDGRIRRMAARLGQERGVVEVPDQATVEGWHRSQVVCVWDIPNRGWRSIPVEGIIRVKISGIWRTVV